LSSPTPGRRRLRPQLSELVSLVERLRWLTALRIGLALTVLAGVTLVPELRGVSAASLLAATGAYAALSVAPPVVIRSSRKRALIVIGGTLLLDGIYLAWVAYATGGTSSPLRFLILLHVVAVTLAASYRTGFKLAAWHSLLFFVTHYAGAAGILDVRGVGQSAIPTDAQFWTLAASTVGAVWAAALVSAAFSSVNERELRTQKADLDDLSAMVREMEASAGTPEICRVLLDELCRVFGFTRGAVLASPNGTLEVMASRGRAGGATPTVHGVDPIMREAWNERRVRLVRAVDPATDPRVAALVPDGRDLVLAPMCLPGGGRVGIVILEHPGGGGIKRWVVSLIEQYVAHAALSLHNTWLVAELEERLQENRALQQRLVVQNSSLEVQVEARTRELSASLEELRLADDERRRILARLVDAQEEERQRVANDIHDDPIQKLVAISMRLQLLRKQAGDGETGAKLDDLVDTVRLTIKGMRHMIFELRPTVLDSLGVGPALVEYLETTGGPPEFEVEDDLDEEPVDELRLILYRITQEALANVRKHANASRVHVRLAQQDGGYLVRIEDDGDGFDPPEMLRSAPGHLGLSSMRERAEMAGGWCKVHSVPGSGTTVDFWVPEGANRSFEPIDPEGASVTELFAEPRLGSSDGSEPTPRWEDQPLTGARGRP
jgi:signal transduction histidine kinase